MIHEITADLAVLLVFTASGSVCALVYRTVRAVAKAVNNRVVLSVADGFAGVSAGAVYILASDALCAGRITFASAATYIISTLAFISFMSAAELPSEKKIASLLTALSSFFKKAFARIKRNRVPKEDNGSPVRHFFKKRVTTYRECNASPIRRGRRLSFRRDSSRRRGRSAS